MTRMKNSEDESNNSDANENQIPKISFKRLKFALKGVTEIAIPLHIQLLKEQIENIDTFKSQNHFLQLRSEQVKAAKTVQLLKDDIHQLEQLNAQTSENDSEWFQQTIESPIRDTIEILSYFMELHSDILDPCPDIEDESEDIIPPLVCDIEKSCSSENIEEPLNHLDQIQIVKESPLVLQSRWLSLKKELLEVHELIKRFGNLIFSQKKHVDQIEDNIIQTHENVQIGTKHLKKAAVLKAASLPIAGAIVGGLLLGPIGALAGFKVIGSAACAASGGLLGFSAGWKLKQKRQISCDIELKALTYPIKSHSHSDPALVSTSEDLHASNKKTN